MDSNTSNYFQAQNKQQTVLVVSAEYGGEMSPVDFDACVKSGGRVRTLKLKNGKYMRVCYDKKGKSHAGEVRKTEGK